LTIKTTRMASDRPSSGESIKPSSGVRVRIAPYLLIAALALIFFGPLVLHPTHILYSDHSDFIIEHVPAKRFLVESWRETGQLPQWCPYNLGGMPFLHDTQVAAYYPPHLPLFLVPESLIGPPLSWLTVAHVVVAGWGMFAYARRRGFGRAGALVAALGFMFAGKWLMHVLAAGHIVVLGVAWVPWVLLLLEEAMRRGSVWHATLAGAGFALIVLSAHPQMTFYAGLFVALWTVETAQAAGWKHWFLCGACTAAVAAALSAVELLPTIAAARLASRWGGTAGQNPLFDTRNILQLFGPFLGSMRHEQQSGIGVLQLAVAGLAIWLSPRRARWPALVFVILAIFAFGGGALLRSLPGLTLFRLPTRMMQLAAFPLAFLAGMAVDALVVGLRWNPTLHRRCLLWVAGVGVIGVGLVLLAGHVTGEMIRVLPYVASAAITLGIAAWLVVSSRGSAPTWKVSLLVVLLLADSWILAWGLVAVRPETEIYAASPAVRYLIEHRNERGRVLDRDWTQGTSTSPLGTGTPLALLHRLEVVRGYEPLDVLRYKEFLQMIEDRDTPIRAGNKFTFPAMIDIKISNLPLLDLFGVRYVLQPAEAVPASPTWRNVMEDESPVAYEMTGLETAGMHALPPYVVYRNPNALPRAFVVREASPLPERSRVLAAMKQTDFRRHVLLEDFTPAQVAQETADTEQTAVAIVNYQPDRIEIQVGDGPGGWLVLTDVWYPGWSCSIDGNATPVHRANFLFRAVAVPAGAQEVVFTFALPRYDLGKRLSGLTLAAVMALGVCSLVWPRLRGAARP
jgi:hypothetical protein